MEILHRKLYVFFVLWVLALVTFIPKTAFAHATLEHATPIPDSFINSSPNEVTLLFNERLEKELYSIKVFNKKGESVSSTNTRMSKDQKQIIQPLPKLPNGTYTISYHIISSDGHPVEGSYIFTIGKNTGFKNNSVMYTGSATSTTDLKNEYLFSTIRIFYYIIFILLTGWIIWGSFYKDKGSSEARMNNRKWSQYLQIAFLLSNISMGIILFIEFMDSWDIKEIWSILSGTTAGISWITSMFLTVIGFLFLLKNRWFDRVWVLLLLLTKAVNGHALAFGQPIVTITLDVIHLLAAAIWAGGLLFIILNWKRQFAYVQNFLVIFSKVAFISIFVLIITGIFSTVIFLPRLSYVIYTKWGILLLIKVALVLIVIIVGAVLRSLLKKKLENIKTWLKIDFSLMIIILCIVGVFTHLNPLPQNNPLEWSDRKGDIDFTAFISPKKPGENHFMVDAETHQEGLKIKRIELFLINQDNNDVAPIKVPFSKMEESENVSYMINGQYLPFPGKWKAEIRILDSEDNEQVFMKEFMVY